MKDDYLGTARVLLSQLPAKDVWLKIEPDEKCKRAKGQLHVRISEEKQNVSPDSSNKIEMSRVGHDGGHVKLDVLEARGLLAADIGGKSDPYIKVCIGKREVFKTEIKKKTLDPVWNASCRIDVAPDEEDIALVCYDSDLVKKDDYLGQTILRFSELLAANGCVDIWPDIEPLSNNRKNKNKQNVLIFGLTSNLMRCAQRRKVRYHLVENSTIPHKPNYQELN